MARPKSEVRTERLCVTLPEVELKAAKKAAFDAGVTWADFVRQALLSQAALDRGVLPPRPIRKAAPRPEPMMELRGSTPAAAVLDETAHEHKAGEMRSGGFRPCVVRGCAAVRVDGRWVEGTR